MPARTLFLSKLIGLLLIAVGLSALIHGQRMADTIDGLLRDRPLIYLASIFALAGGLAMVLLHNRWSGGMLPVVVTILGWQTLIKGLLLLLLPPQALLSLYTAAQFGRLLYLYAAIDLVLGIYLTLAAFAARPRME